ncbi:MAG TPA: DPP IV N-terminal domain-containing protein, partial [Gemmatimonadaceae bacterium]|nr:DPP IV N-terminal domain-containing protein [Gemmatimonadaceae bacterium]
DAMRQRNTLFLLATMRESEHVVTHEMVHQFQYDFYNHGHAGWGLPLLIRNGMPAWFAEGMAEYLSIGRTHSATASIMRDAALADRLPTIRQMATRPDRYFPYRYGESVFEYIGRRWGDDVIGDIMADVPSVGVDQAIARQLSMSEAELSDAWREAVREAYLPSVAERQRVRTFATPVLTEHRTGGRDVYYNPALSPDGKSIVFIATGSFFRGEVFPDLWLGDAITGKRITRLVRTTTNPDFEELRIVYSQPSFSPDGRLLAFTAQHSGKDVLYVLDVARRSVRKRFALPVDGVTGPTWSPDGSRIAFSGTKGGVTDLYVVDTSGTGFRALTHDILGDIQPQWSPDGRYIAFATERGPELSLAELHFPRLVIATYDLMNGVVEILPEQTGLNTNPQWSPDGASIAYISDRTGTANVFLYDRASRTSRQITNVVGMVNGVTEWSPALSWARDADRLAFSYYENGHYEVWALEHPSSRPTTVAERDTMTLPAPAPPPGSTLTLAHIDSAGAVLPDTTRFKDFAYHPSFTADYIAEPTIGYGADAYGSGIFGGTAVFLSDLLGDQHLSFAGQLNGNITDAIAFASYTNLSHRLQFALGVSEAPLFLLTGDVLAKKNSAGDSLTETQALTRQVYRTVFGQAQYPLNRFTRFELGARFNNIDQTTYFLGRTLVPSQNAASGYNLDSTRGHGGTNYLQPYVGYVSDNTLIAFMGPISGRRYRLEFEPAIGVEHWTEYAIDYRRYVPIVFDYVTLAMRAMGDLSFGAGENFIPKYIGNPYFLRGYDRDNFYTGGGCTPEAGQAASCNLNELFGSRVAVGNLELRFPLVRDIPVGFLPVVLPALDGLIFADVGMAWSRGQTIYLQRPRNYNEALQRYPLASYGAGLRLNLYNIAVLRWDYAIPLSIHGSGYWRWSIGPSF